MSIRIRHYETKDKKVLQDVLEQLQDHLVMVDNDHLLVRKDGWGEAYLKMTLEKVVENGAILLAEENGQVVGAIVLKIGTRSNLDQLGGTTDVPRGRILELVVDEHRRSTGIGSLLVSAAERWFLERDVEYVGVEVLSSNVGADHFYTTLGYHDRTQYKIKQIM